MAKVIYGKRGGVRTNVRDTVELMRVKKELIAQVNTVGGAKTTWVTI